MAGILRSFYSEPPTLLDMLVECSQFIDKARHDPGCSKKDVLESMENRMSLLVGKVASHPTSTAFIVFPPPPAEDEPPSMAMD
jgi:hypothetical protein